MNTASRTCGGDFILGGPDAAIMTQSAFAALLPFGDLGRRQQFDKASFIKIGQRGGGNQNWKKQNAPLHASMLPCLLFQVTPESVEMCPWHRPT